MDRSRRFTLFPQDWIIRESDRSMPTFTTLAVQYVPVTDEEAVEAFEYLSRTEGIIPAIESAHAVAYARKNCSADGQGSVRGHYHFRKG